MLSPEEVYAVLAEIEAMPEKKFKKERGVDLDDVLWLLLRHHAAATVRHETWLRDAFFRFDTDAPGLQECEFSQLCKWALGPRSGLSSMDIHSLFRHVEELADQGGADPAR